MKLYKVQLSTKDADFIYVATEDQSYIGRAYPSAVEVKYIGEVTVITS